MEENQLSQMTSWHLSTRFESLLCLGPLPCGTQQDSESSPGVQPAREALLRRRLHSPAQRRSGGVTKIDGHLATCTDAFLAPPHNTANPP